MTVVDGIEGAAEDGEHSRGAVHSDSGVAPRRMRSDRTTPSRALDEGLDMIELGLDRAQYLVVDDIRVPQLKKLGAFRLQGRESEPPLRRVYRVDLEAPLGVGRMPLDVTLVLLDQASSVSDFSSLGQVRQLLPNSRRRGLRGGKPRGALFALHQAVTADLQPADEQRQSKAVDDERDRNDARGEKDDQLTTGEGGSGRGRQRNRQCGSERQCAANARP